MNFQVIRDEETVEKHKDFIRRLRYLEFDFHTLFLNRGNFISPYYEQKIIPSEENGYSKFLLDLQTLLKEMEQAGFMYWDVKNLREHYSKSFTQRGARNYVDFALFNIITQVFSSTTLKLAKMSGGVKKILKAINAQIEEGEESFNSLEPHALYNDIKSLLQHYSNEWLGSLSLADFPLTMEGIQEMKEDYEHLLYYFKSLSTTRNEIKNNLTENTLEILKLRGISLDVRMQELFDDADLTKLLDQSYNEAQDNLIPYSIIERAVVASSYLNLVNQGVSRDVEQAKVHSDRVLELQSVLERQLGYRNYFIQMHERHLLDLERDLTKASDENNEAEVERLSKIIARKLEAQDFAYAQSNCRIQYAKNLGDEQQIILAILASIYKEYGYMIYHNPQYLEFYADYSLRVSKLFVQFHPKAHNEGYPEVFPFHIRDGVIERYLVESICGYQFKPLTLSDVLSIMAKKNLKSEVIYQSYMKLQSSANKALNNYQIIASNLRTLKGDLESSDIYGENVSSLTGTNEVLEKLCLDIQNESISFRLDNYKIPTNK